MDAPWRHASRPGRCATSTSSAPSRQPRRTSDAVGHTGAGLLLHRDDLREAQREGREGNLVLFVVDASGSMAARRRMAAVSGAVLSLLRDAYQRRDKVGLISCRAGGAELLLPPTSSVEAAAKARLPRCRPAVAPRWQAGLLEAHAVLGRERLRDPQRRPLLVVVTDGRATAGAAIRSTARCRPAAVAADGVAAVVVDCESGPVRLGLAGLLAELGGPVVCLEELDGRGWPDLADEVRARRRVG